MSGRDWRRYGAFYQIYPRSFADSNGDGIGDLDGIRSRLPYLSSLGVDAVWSSAWFDSPFRDGGYDVADYRRIHPLLGTNADARLLFEEAAQHDLGVLFDLVPNHTSTDHPWFRTSVEAAPGSPARRRYHFLPGRGPDGAAPPNDWESGFGGPAWTRLPDGQWYLHQFDPAQPELNWTDPGLAEEFDEIIRFWIDLGASGFRTDVAHCLAKDMSYPDWRGTLGDHHIPLGHDHPYRDRPDVHDIARRWRALIDSYDRELIMVAEAVVSPWQRLARYLRPDEYHQVFDFEFLETPWDADSLREVIDISLVEASAVGALPTWVLSNHDVVRPATRYALPVGTDAADWLLRGDRALLDHDLGLRRATALAMLAMALPGAYFMYQGEELGLPEAYDLPVEVLEDPIYARSARTLKGRDGCRVPIPWTRDGCSLGFGAAEPWLPQPDEWSSLSVEAQIGDRRSTLELFRCCLALRRSLDHDDFEWIDHQALAFRRRDLECYVNCTDHPVSVPAVPILASNVPFDGGELPPDAAAWLPATRTD